jgi:hypothetical protein
MNQMALDLSGKELAQAGAKLALDHAEAMDPGWKDRAYAYLLVFVAVHRGQQFMAEDIRGFAYSRGLPKPPSERAWGSIIKRASTTEAKIRAVGTEKVKNAKAHCANATLWEVVV